MSTTDLFAADFPHGTAEGYTRGCHGNGACPGRYESGRTCLQAFTWSKGEFHRSGVAASAEAEAVSARFEELRDTVPEARITETTGKRLLEKATADVVEKPAATEKKRGGRPAGPLQHGTRYGYERGCRDPEACPRGEDGRSCTQAAREYQRESNRKRAVELARLRGEPEPKRRKTRDEAPVPPAPPEPAAPVSPPAQALADLAAIAPRMERAIAALTAAVEAMREINNHLNTYQNGGR